jgi:hypothetical protein
MKHVINILTIFILTSCSINLYRPEDRKPLDINKETQQFLASIKTKSDTILMLKSSDCQIYSEKKSIIVYKISNETKSRAFSTYGKYPKEPTIGNFHWNLIYTSLKDIKEQKAKPAYFASVIEGDTIWHELGEPSGETIWTFTLMTKNDSAKWEITSSESSHNPSMVKTKVCEYIFDETTFTMGGTNRIYGEMITKKKPLIGHKNTN